MKKTLRLALFVLFFTGTVSLLEASEVRLDGIVEGLSGDAGTWTAVINGEVVTEGQEIAGYRLAEVGEKSVRLEKLPGGEVRSLAVGEVLGDEGSGQEDSKKENVSEPAGWLESFIRKHFPQLVQFSESVQYASVVKDIRVVYQAAMIEYMNAPNPDRVSPSIPALAAAGKIPRFFQSGVSQGYRFRIQSADLKLRVYADPVEAGSGKKHFLMDEHGYLYAEDGRQATTASERFQNGFRLQVQADS